MLMSIACWVVLGLVAGFVGNKVVNGRGDGVVLDIVLGIVGALVGGWIFNAIGSTGMTGFNVWSFFVAIVGSVVLLIIAHALGGRAFAHEHSRYGKPIFWNNVEITETEFRRWSNFCTGILVLAALFGLGIIACRFIFR